MQQEYQIFNKASRFIALQSKMESLMTKESLTRGWGRDEIFVAAVPLRAAKGPPQLLMSAAYSLNLWDLQHFMVIIKPYSSPPPSSQSRSRNWDVLFKLTQKRAAASEFGGTGELRKLVHILSLHNVLVFDFQPKDPEDMYVALEVLAGRAVPGAILVRKMTKLPRRKCWFVGLSEVGSVERAKEFNKTWATNLRIGHHDCRDYANGLVNQLTGKEEVLERLRSIDGY